MLISHAHRFIYMVVPRTASTSTREILRHALKPGQFDELKRTPNPLPGASPKITVHVRARVIRELFPRAWDSYRKIANIRHPYTRCLSAFSYWLADYAPQTLKDKLQQDSSPLLLAEEYEAFLRRRNFPMMSEEKEKGYYFLDGAPFEVETIRYEHLHADLEQFSRRFALALDVKKHLPWHSQFGAQARRWTVSQLMTKEAKALIDERYGWYFERFGYRKEIAD